MKTRRRLLLLLIGLLLICCGLLAIAYALWPFASAQSIEALPPTLFSPP